jgi:hypothetical protein
MFHIPSEFKLLLSLTFLLYLTIRKIKNIDLNMQNYKLYFNFLY